MGLPSSSVSESSASSRSRTRCATLDIWPSHVGVPSTRMSAPSTLSRNCGHWSPFPMSCPTPG
ncbi:Uncharacterised protein [Mycobacteroides abscessus subsp. abscessus]|nr:Uncharacterised protein [Mycobacteroides abscessus subsp. abscessus]